jgi:hypothetical protein
VPCGSFHACNDDAIDDDTDGDVDGDDDGGGADAWGEQLPDLPVVGVLEPSERRAAPKEPPRAPVTAPAPRVRRKPGTIIGELQESKESCGVVWKAATVVDTTPADATDVQRLQLWVMKGPAMVSVFVALYMLNLLPPPVPVAERATRPACTHSSGCVRRRGAHRARVHARRRAAASAFTLHSVCGVPCGPLPGDDDVVDDAQKKELTLSI